MRSSEWLDRLTANAEVATFLGSISASSDTVESDEAMLYEVPKKEDKNFIVEDWHSAEGEVTCRNRKRTLGCRIATHKIFVTIRILDYYKIDYAGKRGDFHHRLVAVARPALETRQRPGEVIYVPTSCNKVAPSLSVFKFRILMTGGVLAPF
jgi:hypothetical protein